MNLITIIQVLLDKMLAQHQHAPPRQRADPEELDVELRSFGLTAGDHQWGDSHNPTGASIPPFLTFSEYQTSQRIERLLGDMI